MAFLGILNWNHHVIFGTLFVDLSHFCHEIVFAVGENFWAELLKLIVILS